jgi:hypothetical protein
MAAADVKGVRSLFLQNAPEEKPNPQPSKKAEQHAPEEDWIGKNENWI